MQPKHKAIEKVKMSDIVSKSKTKHPDRFSHEAAEQRRKQMALHEHKELSENDKIDYQNKTGRAYSE